MEGNSNSGDGTASNSQVNNNGKPEWDFKGWGGSQNLKESDVEIITGCPGGIGCCECCHIKPCCCNSCLTCPRHPTVNQFYTPTMFTAYHREGYRACMECDDFLGIN